MYIVTVMSYEQLAELVKNKKVSISNSDLLLGQYGEVFDDYFKNLVGNNGYVLGLQGRLNRATQEIFTKLDSTLADGKVILEAEIDEEDFVAFAVDEMGSAVTALQYGLGFEDALEHLEKAREDLDKDKIKVLCVPYIERRAPITVTAINDDLTFNVEGMIFVKL